MYLHSFRDHHLLQLLESYFNGSGPLDVAICRYFRQHKALGSKDRHAVAEAAYGLIRWQGLLEALAPTSSWLDKLRIFGENPWQHTEGLPPHVAVSFPESLYNRFSAAYGAENARQLCLVCNETAPVCVRVNTLKTSREKMLEMWEGRYPVRPTERSPDGIIFEQKVQFSGLSEYQSGLFEIQDEGSQLVAQLVNAQMGDLVLDYCSGAGGKALAIAPKMANRGQLFLHDIRPFALTEAKRRLRRAGVENAQFLTADSGILDKYKKKMDLILVDAPCSGTGTLRRNPDMKWRFSEEMVERLKGQQRSIFERALSFLKPGGRIVYATCSMLPEENEEQIAHFEKTYGLALVQEPLKTIPRAGEMDGFFGAVMARSCHRGSKE